MSPIRRGIHCAKGANRPERSLRPGVRGQHVPDQTRYPLRQGGYYACTLPEARVMGLRPLKPRSFSWPGVRGGHLPEGPRRESNTQPPELETGALPLSYEVVSDTLAMTHHWCIGRVFNL
jgi:hypothetical protein